MAEYIERESIYKILLMENPFGWNNDDLAELFREAKAADVAPVVHGRWISKNHHGYEWVFVCSNCGYIDGYPFNDRFNYCPNCGAKMDETVEDDKQ